MSLIAENPEITASELTEAVGITPKGVEWQIARLKKEGGLKRIGPAKGGRWTALKMKLRNTRKFVSYFSVFRSWGQGKGTYYDLRQAK